jgi:bleomycin hydrolase
MMNAITKKSLNEMRSAYEADDKARVVRNALVKNNPASISRVQEAAAENPNLFSINIKTLPVTNQMQSGRCWIFSSMNVLREMIANKYKIKDFELSQNYISFYDKLEKANWFMNCVLKEIDNPLNSENMRFLLQYAVGDGGQWNMIQSLVKKYGICPKTAMPETYSSSHTASMNEILNKRLRKFASDAKKAADAGKKEELSALKDEALKEIYGLIASCVGLPPKEFTFEYYDRSDKYHAEYHVTPKQMYGKYLGADIDDYINVINAPTEDKPYFKTFTVKYLGNVADGNPICLLNLPMKDFKKAAVAQMKDNAPVWFGCDCGPDGDRESGLWDDKQCDYANTFDMNLDMSKAEMLDTYQSAMNHAMVLTGVNLGEDGKPNRWKIENSWGEKIANKGYFLGSDTWFDKYVYVIAVNKKYLPKKALDALKKKPIELAPWDPFGTLAD